MSAAQPNFWAGLMPTSKTPTTDGLEVVSEVLIALADGVPVPQRSAEFLAQALRPCLHGENDIAGRLGLRAPGRGRRHEAAAALKKTMHRDALIRSIVAEDADLPLQGAILVLEILWLHHFLSEPDENRSTPPRARRIIELARAHGRPLSHRQIRRIVKGQTAYAARADA